MSVKSIASPPPAKLFLNKNSGLGCFFAPVSKWVSSSKLTQNVLCNSFVIAPRGYAQSCHTIKNERSLSSGAVPFGAVDYVRGAITKGMCLFGRNTPVNFTYKLF
jgi:hypothetical protein